MATIIDLPDTADHHRPTAPEVRAQLERLLADPAMRASARRRDFLRFIVAETLAGRAEQLKGFTIALAVFGRDEDFDQQADPVVRIEARRLRRDLDCYYIDAGRDEPVRISIPLGGYVPHFDRQPGAALATRPEPEETLSPGNAAEAPAGETVGRKRKGDWRRFAVATAAGIMALTALAVRSWYPANPGPAEEPGVAMAVLPFVPAGADEDTRFLSAGLSQQLVTDLMLFGGLRLYQAPAPATGDIAAFGEGQGLRYLVSGTVASEANRVRIGARLTEADSGRVLWSHTYDRTLSPQALLDAQADLAAEIATALGQPYGPVQSDFARRAADGAAATMPSYACVLRANLYRRGFTADAWRPALACLEGAVAQDPDYAEAWAMLGWLRMDGIRFDFVPDTSEGFDAAFDAAEHALALDPANVTALKALSSIRFYAGDHAEAERLQRQALALNPNDPDTLAQLGWRLAARGDWAEGIPHLERAISRTLDPPGWYHHLIAVDAYRRGDYPAMLEAARRATSDGSGISWSLLAIAQGAIGDKAGASASLGRMAAASPRLASDPAAIYRGHQVTEETVRLLMNGLTAAGWRTQQP